MQFFSIKKLVTPEWSLVRPREGLTVKEVLWKKRNFLIAGLVFIQCCIEWEEISFCVCVAGGTSCVLVGSQGNCLPLVLKEYIIIETKENKGFCCFRLPSQAQRRKVSWLAKRDKLSPEWGNCMDLCKTEVAGGWVAAAEKELCFCMPHSSIVGFITWNNLYYKLLSWDFKKCSH